MKRPTEPQNAIVAAPAHPPVVRSISGVCSECGITYQADANNGNVAWTCPRCGPSTPISVKDPKDLAANKRRRTRGTRFPRVRVPFVLVQLLIISLTFVVFMGLLLNYMNRRFPARKNLVKAPVAQHPQRGAPLPHDPDLPREQRVARDDPVADGTHGQTGGQSEATGTELEADSGSHPGTNVAAETSGSADPSQPSNHRPADSSTRQNAIASREVGPTLVIDGLPLSEADHCMTIREIVNAYPRWFGREVTMQCRLTKICDDAVGQVPSRFYINDQQFMLSEQDESRYVRLEVVDARGESLPCVFAQTDGPLGRELQWIMPGDWLLLTATTGVRYEQTASEAYGLILIKVAALEENSHDGFDQATKKLAER